MEVAVITSGCLPVPPTKGGAVENIIYNIIKENEKYDACRFTVYSIEDENSECFHSTEIEHIKTSAIAHVLDHILYFCAKNIFRKEHLISYRYFFQRMEFMRKVGRALHSKPYDRVILENNVVMFRALTYRDNLEKYKGKIYYHAHNEVGVTLGYDKYLCRTRKIIGVSDYITDCYRKLAGSGATEYETVHNAIDETIFSKKITLEEKAELKKKIGIDIRHPVLFFAGRLTKEKGIAELLEALAQIETENYTLLIAGQLFFGAHMKDSFEEHLHTLMKEVKGKVIFTGYVPYEDMYRYYQIADLCVLPSVWNEPCALTVIECIVSGIPLITTRTGGTPENATKATILLETDDLVRRLKEQLEKYLTFTEELQRLREETGKYKFRYGTLEEYYRNFLRALDIREERCD